MDLGRDATAASLTMAEMILTRFSGLPEHAGLALPID